MLKTTACSLTLLCSVLSAAEEQWAVPSHGMNVPFRSWHAEGAKTGAGVLVLVPGYNGKGEQMLDARWKAFATKNNLVLLAPTFHAEGKENNEGKGYFYPEQGSGEVMEKALHPSLPTMGIAKNSPSRHFGHFLPVSRHSFVLN